MSDQRQKSSSSRIINMRGAPSNSSRTVVETQYKRPREEDRLYNGPGNRESNNRNIRQRRQYDSNGATAVAVKSAATSAPINIVTSKPELRDANSQPEVVNRNKRLFGSLMGHLNLARKKLQSDSDIISRQQERLQEAAQKNSEEAQRLNEKTKLQRLKKKLDSDIRAVEVSNRQFLQQQRQRQRQRRDGICTVATPSVAWLPARHNAVTAKLLSDQETEIERLIAERNQQDEERLQELRSAFNKETGVTEDGATAVAIGLAASDVAATTATTDEETDAANEASIKSIAGSKEISTTKLDTVKVVTTDLTHARLSSEVAAAAAAAATTTEAAVHKEESTGVVDTTADDTAANTVVAVTVSATSIDTTTKSTAVDVTTADATTVDTTTVDTGITADVATADTTTTEVTAIAATDSVSCDKKETVNGSLAAAPEDTESHTSATVAATVATEETEDTPAAAAAAVEEKAAVVAESAAAKSTQRKSKRSSTKRS